MPDGVKAEIGEARQRKFGNEVLLRGLALLRQTDNVQRIYSRIEDKALALQRLISHDESLQTPTTSNLPY